MHGPGSSSLHRRCLQGAVTAKFAERLVKKDDGGEAMLDGGELYAFNIAVERDVSLVDMVMQEVARQVGGMWGSFACTVAGFRRTGKCYARTAALKCVRWRGCIGLLLLLTVNLFYDRNGVYLADSGQTRFEVLQCYML